MLSITVPNRVLILDDAVEARAVLEAYLKHHGYEVLTAASSTEA